MIVPAMAHDHATKRIVARMALLPEIEHAATIALRATKPLPCSAARRTPSRITTPKDLELALDARSALGKENKRLRRQGIVPGVVFGKGSPSVPVQVDAKAFDTLYRQAGRTSIVKITVDGKGTARSAIIKEIQRHPISGRAVHVDFFLVNLTQEMQADVPLSFVGTAPAIEMENGTLMTPLGHLKVKALPSEMPREIEVDISSLVDMEAAIHVRDLPIDPKVTVLNDPDEMLARVLPPRVEEEPETVAEEAVLEEGEVAEGEPETDAAGEAPAEDAG
jgi:large subunit ribosomal protein L25